ncbi:FAD binding domain-containing protein [Coralliovum pocilloporae]|uniref:FAD binding domain-containing protein n=1 Tax=Coralliovum pocilloporae TaxID=3066369 RepID=UPI0033076B0A
MYETTYHKASSVADAASKLTSSDDGKLLAGGQTLIPTMKQRLAAPSDLVDLGRIDGLDNISSDGTSVTIGAMATHASVSSDDGVQSTIPSLACLAAGIGDPHVRNRGTIGGSVANNDPAADYPAAVLGLNASVNTNKRTIAADEFFSGLFETALDEDEIIESITFAKPQRAGYAKFPNPASRYAMTGVFVAQLADGSVRVAVTGAGNDGVFRVAEMEAALAANWSADAIASFSVSADDMLGDIHGTQEYRANLVTVMAKRAVDAAV